MERPENKKRKSRERDHEKKKRKKNHNLLKINAKKLEFRRSNISDHHQYNYELNKNDNDDRRKDKNDINYHHRDRTTDDENLNQLASSSSSDVVKGELGIFDFPWLKDEDGMFRADDFDKLCRSSLEEDMIFQQQMSFEPLAAHNPYHLYFDDLHDYNTKTWTEINYQISDKQEYCVDSKFYCASEFDRDNELSRMEYYIWTAVLDQPLN